METLIDAADRVESLQPQPSKLSAYYLRVINDRNITCSTYSILANDDFEAVENAYIMCGPHKGELWKNTRLIHEIEKFEFRQDRLRKEQTTS